MKLVLAEKPSVAQSIAKVLGAAKREDGYLEGNGYVVSWCVGHLVELAQPEVYDAKYSKWAYADLPIFPMDWQYEVSAGTKKQFGILKKLMAREDVASLVCATDAGREGELIFRLVYHKAGCRKPFERLWISSMEDVAIKEGFENLRSGTEYDALYEAALCRERADWIVGINATRLFSTLYGQTLNVGRVMTPTLAMAVMREAAISAFKPELFYTVQIGLDGFTAASERFKTKAAAEAVKQSCSVAIVQKAECKEKTEKPPALYDLTSLQREANRVLGYTAQQTLDYTQNLYEKKLVTYPRTDSRFLTEDMAHSLTDLVKLAFHTFPVEDVDNIPVHAEQVVNNKKVTDHHAIIPTRELQKCNLSELPKGELAILQLISNRLCVAVGDPHRYAETVIELDCGGTVFSTKGKTVVQDGWKALVQKNDSTKSDENVQTLPSVSVEEYDELNIEVAFKNAVANSVSYTMYCRFVESPDNYFEHEDFQKVFDFNTRQTVNALGTAVNAISTRMFQEIEKAIGEHEQIKATERSTDYERDDLQTGRRLSDSEPSVGERGRETSGQVRQDASSIFGTEQSDAPERHDSDGEPVPAPVGDRGNSESQSGVSDGAVPEGQPLSLIHISEPTRH